MDKRLIDLKKKIDNDNRHIFKYEGDQLIIDMEIHNDNDFLDEFSSNDYPIINNKIDDYIQKYIASAKITDKFLLRISNDCIDKNEEKVYSTAIKNFYIDKYISNKEMLKQNRLISLIIGIFGAIILGLVIILEYTGQSEFWMRILDIVSWVFIWEAVDINAFKCKQLRLEQTRNLNLIDMNIEFIKKEKHR